jgi:hypothetical protein
MISSSSTTILSGIYTFIGIFVFSSVVLKFLSVFFPEDSDKPSNIEEDSKD